MIISYLIIMIIHHENSSLIHHWFTQMAILGPLLGPVCHRWPWLWPWLSSWLWPWLWVRVSPGETQRYSVDPVGQYFMWLMASQLEKFRFYMFLLHINITSLSHIYTYIYIYQIYGINTYKHDWFCWISLGLSSLSSLSIAVSPRVHHVWRSHLSHLSPSEISVSTRFKNQLWTAIATAISTHHNTWKRSHHPNRSPSLETKPSFLASAASTVLASAVWGSATLGRNDHLGEPSPCHVLLGKCW